jgi:hypothetical protein
VLPVSLTAQFAHQPGADPLVWVSSDGQRHPFKLTSPAPQEANGAPPPDAIQAAPSLADDLLPLHVDSPHACDEDEIDSPAPMPRRAAADGKALDSVEDASVEDASETSRLRGTLLHRLVQRVGLTRGDADADSLLRLVRQLIRSDDRQSLGDTELVCAAVVAAYRRLAARADIRAYFEEGDVFHEVPFTLREGSATIRGTIDCLVRRHSNSQEVTPTDTLAADIVVLELKTGRRRPEHLIQLALYRRAAASVFPDARIDGSIVYLDDRTPS